jgi:hypothetical protein
MVGDGWTITAPDGSSEKGIGRVGVAVMGAGDKSTVMGMDKGWNARNTRAEQYGISSARLVVGPDRVAVIISDNATATLVGQKTASKMGTQHRTQLSSKPCRLL